WRTSSSRSWARSRTSTIAPRRWWSGSRTAATAWRAGGAYRRSTNTRCGELRPAALETVAGLVRATVNRIPAVGEVFDVGPHEFTVLEADERRILKVRITPPDRPHPKTAAKED